MWHAQSNLLGLFAKTAPAAEASWHSFPDPMPIPPINQSWQIQLIQYTYVLRNFGISNRGNVFNSSLCDYLHIENKKTTNSSRFVFFRLLAFYFATTGKGKRRIYYEFDQQIACDIYHIYNIERSSYKVSNIISNSLEQPSRTIYLMRHDSYSICTYVYLFQI